MTATTTTHRADDTQPGTGGVVAPSFDPGQHAGDTQRPHAGSDTFDHPPATRPATPKRLPLAGGDSNPPTPAMEDPTPIVSTPEWEAFDTLRVFAECLADAMDHRIAMDNRLRSGTVPADIVAEIKADLTHTEKQLRRGMVAAFRRAAPDVADWTRDTVGLGEETMARLIGAIGHPVIARPHHWEGEGTKRQLVADEPFLRSVSQLWSYCGHGDPTRRKRKGMSADDAMALGSPHAKKLVYLLSVACMKCVGSSEERPPTTTCSTEPMVESSLVDPLDPTGQTRRDTHPCPAGGSPLDPTGHPRHDTHGTHAGGSPLENADANGNATPRPSARRRSPYRDTYDLRRAHTAERDDWTDGHKHADALRITGKHILRDLWIVTRQNMDTEP
jgi:hypothetical protein